MNVNILILCVLFPVAALWKMRFCPKVQAQVPLFSKDQSDYWKGIAALMVVFAHYVTYIGKEVQIPFILEPFRLLGPLGVAIFFFLSGYGLFAAYGLEKLHFNFVLKRILTVYIPYVCIRILFYPFLELKGVEVRGISDYIRYVLGITVAQYWFIIVIMCMYLIYFLTSRIKTLIYMKLGILIFSITMLSVILYSWKGTEYSYWWGNNILFLIGVLYAFYQHKLMELLRSKYVTLCLCTLGAFFCTCILYFKLEKIWLVADKALAGILLVNLIILLTRRCNLCSPFITYMGKHSLYLYLTHIQLYQVISRRFNILNPIVIAVYFLSVIIIPVFLKKVLTYVLSGLNRKLI